MTGNADAYRYLPDSTQAFRGQQRWRIATMRAAGFVDVGLPPVHVWHYRRSRGNEADKLSGRVTYQMD